MKRPFGQLVFAVVLADDCVESHISNLRGIATVAEDSNTYNQTTPKTYTLAQAGESINLRLAQNLTERADATTAGSSTKAGSTPSPTPTSFTRRLCIISRTASSWWHCWVIQADVVFSIKQSTVVRFSKRRKENEHASINQSLDVRFKHFRFLVCSGQKMWWKNCATYNVI